MAGQGNLLADRASTDLASSNHWRSKFSKNDIEQWHVHEAGFYYDLLCNEASRLDIWHTTYTHVLAGVEAITQWYKGSSLKPILDTLTTAEEQDRFLHDFTDAIRPAYPLQQDDISQIVDPAIKAAIPTTRVKTSTCQGLFTMAISRK